MLFQNAQNFLDLLSAKNQEEEQDLIKPKINIRSSLGMFAFGYEKIRNFIDYQEEHLLLRRAINRILTRRIKTNNNANYLASSLVTELLMARYLKNGFLSEYKIPEIERIISKYLYLFQKVSSRNDRLKEGSIEFLFSLASREIEELISPGREDQLANFALKIFEERIDWTDGREEENRALLFVGILRSLSKYDDRTIFFKLWKLYFPGWTKGGEKTINDVAGNFNNAVKEINYCLDDFRGEPLLRILKKQIAPFEILRDLISQNYSKIQQDFSLEEKLLIAAREAVKSRYHRAITKLRRSAVNSFIYIFVTKMVLALAIEIPYELFISSGINYFPLAINLILPPGLMVLLSLSVESPKEGNTEKIINEISSMMFGNNKLSLINVDLDRKKPKIMTAVFNIVYFLVFFLVFGLTIYLLRKLQFSVVSIGIFFFFISTISFFAFRIRSSFKELVVGEEDSNFVSTVFDFFMIPFIKLGRIISSGLHEINLLVFLFDIFIETPFKLILEVFEEWIKYLKEKKEETLNVILK